MNEIEAKNKSAAFHIYADLCEIRNYGKITAKYAKDLNHIYFETQPKSDKPENIEYVLPIDEQDSNFKMDLIHSLIDYINFNSDQKIKKLKLGITSIDFTTVYYDFTIGLDSPFSNEQLSKVK